MAADAGADLIDLNMGCPVRKVCKTGAGAALLEDPTKAVAIANAARRGQRAARHREAAPGPTPGDRAGLDLAQRLASEAGVAGIAFHPRHASQQHAGSPDYALAASWPRRCRFPCSSPAAWPTRTAPSTAFEQSGAAAVMLARGSLGNPWRFARLLGRYSGEPTPRRSPTS